MEDVSTTIPVLLAGVFAMVCFVFVYGVRSVTPPASHFRAFDDNTSADKKSKNKLKKKKPSVSQNGSHKPSHEEKHQNVTPKVSNNKLPGVANKDQTKKKKTKQGDVVLTSPSKPSKVKDEDYADEGWTKQVSKKDRKQNKVQQSTPKTPPQEDLKESSPGSGKKGGTAKATKKNDSGIKDEPVGKGQGKSDSGNGAVSPGDSSKQQSKKAKAKDDAKKEQKPSESPQKTKGPEKKGPEKKGPEKKKDSPKSGASGDKDQKQTKPATAEEKPNPAAKKENDGWIEVRGSSSPASKKKQTAKAEVHAKKEGPIASSEGVEPKVPSHEPRLVESKDVSLESAPSPSKDGDSQGAAKSKSKKKKQKNNSEQKDAAPSVQTNIPSKESSAKEEKETKVSPGAAEEGSKKTKKKQKGNKDSNLSSPSPQIDRAASPPTKTKQPSPSAPKKEPAASSPASKLKSPAEKEKKDSPQKKKELPPKTEEQKTDPKPSSPGTNESKQSENGVEKETPDIWQEAKPVKKKKKVRRDV